MSIAEKIRSLNELLQGHSGARLVAVSKGQPIEKILEAHAAGQRDFGENYVQELLEKDGQLRARGITDIRWHFLGHLQTNKVKGLVALNPIVHSLDSEKLALEISKRAAAARCTVGAFIEVNVDSEPSKSGVLPAELPELLTSLAGLPGLQLRGLMAIPSREGGVSGAAFIALRRLRDQYRSQLGLAELSMGMSEDYAMALREGSHWIRVGTAIFGPRNV